MKKFSNLHRAILVAIAISLVAAGCSKENPVITNPDKRFGGLPFVAEPTDQQNCDVKGYVIPAEALAVVTFYNSTFKKSAYADPKDGFYLLNDIPEGYYNVDVVPQTRGFQSIHLQRVPISRTSASMNFYLSKN
jgi:hypothetical protein